MDPARFRNVSVLNDGDTQERVVERSGFRFTIDEHVHIPGHILFQVDRDGLLAAYSRFEPGALPEELTAENLGPWERHVVPRPWRAGVPGRRGFLRRCLPERLPAAVGGGPHAVVGSGGQHGPVGNRHVERRAPGNDGGGVRGGRRRTHLAVQLASLDGTLDFTDLEHWEPGQAPQAVGSGTQWGDGDLRYLIGVRDNTFVQTGGDDGEVTGVFLGSAHQAMAGVLERSDLSAGFGGTR